MIKFAAFEFDPAAGLLYSGEEETLLPPKAAAVLHVLLESAGQLVTKDQLLESVWEGAFVTESSLTDAISLLRQVLGDDSRDPTYIQTLHRRGYRFIASVEGSAPEAGIVGSEAVTATKAHVPHEGGLDVGGTLGNYEIVDILGSGTMGTVYRARDTVLEREVAIKALPRDFADDSERVARLEQEAKLLASVSHPNIAAIHTLEEADGIKFPVLELVEGETLQERLRSGSIRVEESLEIARQVASALEAAHEQGIVHRDLKPANIKLTPEGQVKVLDFGLAKALEVRVFGDGAGVSATGSLTIRGTGRGSIVGTAAYMSPEQARGQEVDKRADIWSFGCLLCEMLAGAKPFDRETVTDTLAAIVDQAPDMEALPTNTPSLIRSLVRRCLRKDPNQRLHDIADARIEIEEALTEISAGVDGDHGGISTTATAERGGRSRHTIPISVAASIGVGLVLVTAVVLRVVFGPPAPAGRPTYVRINLPPGLYLHGGHADEARIGGNRPSRKAFALSPDGWTIVYAATDGERGQLYRHRLDRPETAATAITGTEGGIGPFFSADGEWVGFFAEGDLKRVPVDGGQVEMIAGRDVVETSGGGASWTGDTVAYDGPGGIFSIAAGGGDPVRLTEVDVQADANHLFPQLLPDGEALLYTVRKAGFSPRLAAFDIVVRRLGGEPEVVVGNGADARYSPTGHLVFASQGTLMAAPFDLETLSLTGQPVRIGVDVMQAVRASNNSISTGAAQYDFSGGGTLAYAAGGVHPDRRSTSLWVEPTGEATEIPLTPANYSDFRLSGDDRRLAMRGPVRRDTNEADIMWLDVLEGGVTPLEMEGHQRGPVWSPDGTRLAFTSNHEGAGDNIYWRLADGTGDAHPITASIGTKALSDWSFLNVLAFNAGNGAADIWTVDFEGGEETPFLDSPALERWPTFSPDGRLLAYGSDEMGGQYEIYVRPYPEKDPRYEVTKGSGGTRPAWSRDGSQLFYRTGQNNRSKMMAVDVDRAEGFRAGEPRELFDDESLAGSSPTRSYDVSRSGRFVIRRIEEHPPEPVTQIHIVLNWFEDLKERVPARR